MSDLANGLKLLGLLVAAFVVYYIIARALFK